MSSVAEGDHLATILPSAQLKKHFTVKTVRFVAVWLPPLTGSHGCLRLSHSVYNIPHLKDYLCPIQKTQRSVIWAFCFSWAHVVCQSQAFFLRKGWLSHYKTILPPFQALPFLHSTIPVPQLSAPLQRDVSTYKCWLFPSIRCLDIRLSLLPPQQIFCFISSWKTLRDECSFKWTFLIIKYLAFHEMQTYLFAQFYCYLFQNKMWLFVAI